MTAPAAFQACFSDWKLIKGRKVVQVVLEIPIELADQAYNALGGMPDPGKSVWCAVARLDPRAEAEPTLALSTKSSPRQDSAAHGPNSGFNSRDGGRRPFASLPFPQQAALLCADPVFRAFLNEEFNYRCDDEDSAAEALREKCKVASRKDLTTDTFGQRVFIELREQFAAWKLVAA